MKHRADAFAAVRPPTGMPGWLFTLMTLLSVATALVSYRYLGKADYIPAQIQANAHFNPWLAVHVAGAATALLLGPVQFMPVLRLRRPPCIAGSAGSMCWDARWAPYRASCSHWARRAAP